MNTETISPHQDGTPDYYTCDYEGQSKLHSAVLHLKQSLDYLRDAVYDRGNCDELVTALVMDALEKMTARKVSGC